MPDQNTNSVLNSTVDIDIWEDDKLDRLSECEFLSTYLINKYLDEENSEDSFVLNINAEWGFGKTFFMEAWRDSLKQKNYPVVFFNAWKSDYCEDPLIAFISEFQNQLEPYFKEAEPVQEAFENTKKMGWKLFKIGVPIVASIVARKLTGYTFEQIIDIYEKADNKSSDSDSGSEEGKKDIENAVSEIFEQSAKDAIASFEQSKSNVEGFKEQLKDLIEKTKQSEELNAPLFIFIDELDRCRPTYAIELLEKVKHIFNVSGVYFIVATASKQLCHSIKAIYGSEFDAEGYLKRFFNQVYELKEPSYFEFAPFLYEKYGLHKHEDKFFTPLEPKLCNTDDPNIEIFALLSAYFKLGLRDQIQIAANLQTICLTWDSKIEIHLAFMLFLLILKHNSDDVFKHYDQKRELDPPARGSFLAQKVKVNDKVTFKNFLYTTPYGKNQPETVTIFELVRVYFGKLKLSVKKHRESGKGNSYFAKQIYDQLERTIRDQNFNLNDTDILCLSRYFDKVKQLGQFKTDFGKEESGTNS